MKSTQAERAQKINAALSLTKKHNTVSQAADAMTAKYGISKRQAYRYINDANKIGAKIPIPDQKIAFTVKLSQSLKNSDFFYQFPPVHILRRKTSLKKQQSYTCT